MFCAKIIGSREEDPRRGEEAEPQEDKRSDIKYKSTTVKIYSVIFIIINVKMNIIKRKLK